MEALRAKVQQQCDGMTDASEAKPEMEDDPMADLEAESAVADVKSKKTVGCGLKRKFYYLSHVRHTLVVIKMPIHTPEVDPHCEETRDLRLYVEDRKQLWIDIKDVDWCAKYLYVQNHLKGVPLVSDDSTGLGYKP